jgi:hypothetical protein
VAAWAAAAVAVADRVGVDAEAIPAAAGADSKRISPLEKHN